MVRTKHRLVENFVCRVTTRILPRNRYESRIIRMILAMIERKYLVTYDVGRGSWSEWEFAFFDSSHSGDSVYRVFSRVEPS
jgi:hypothetical protein